MISSVHIYYDHHVLHHGEISSLAWIVLDLENRQKAKEMKTFMINLDTTEPMIKATMLK